jgi:hypothetical protein
MVEPITGTEAIRQRVWSRWKRANLGRTSLDLGISLASLEAFAKGEGSLTAAQLQLLTKEFFYHARFDPEADKLIDTSPPSQVIGVAMPGPCDPAGDRYRVQHDPNRRYGLAPDPNAAPHKPRSRPGFATRTVE